MLHDQTKQYSVQDAVFNVVFYKCNNLEMGQLLVKHQEIHL